MKQTTKLTAQMIEDIYTIVDTHDCHIYHGEDGCDCIDVLERMAEYESCPACNEYQLQQIAVGCPAHERLISLLHSQLKVDGI